MANKYKDRNCACCALRKKCGTWNTEVYGDTYKADERDKVPFPDNAVCISFRFDYGYDHDRLGGIR